MPRYTFSFGETSIIAANRAEALVLCQQGQVPVDAIVVQHGEKKDLRFSISHDRELHLAVCAAHNKAATYPDRIPKLGTICMVAGIFCGAVTAGFIFEWVRTESSHRTLVENLRNVGAFALMSGYFFYKSYLELRFQRRESSPQFLLQQTWIHEQVRIGDAVSTALPLLQLTYRLRSRRAGIDAEGASEIIDFEGEHADVRLGAHHGSIRSITVRPKY